MMGKNSAIEWTTHSWNPWQGCHKVSAGCKNCYMYREKKRYGQDPAVVVRSKDPTFYKPLHWRDGAYVFTCSWSDWFIEEADPWRADAWNVVRRTPHLTYQILTKRPENIADRLPGDWGDGWDNVWLGISAEDQEAADERIPLLLRTPAAVRFVSAEPLLGPVFLRPSWFRSDPPQFSQRQVFLGGIDWLIAGGESGPSARPCHPDWLRQLRDQCQAAGVAFFLKQRGEYLTLPEAMEAGIQLSIADALNANSVGLGNGFVRVGKKAAGRLLDGVQWNEMPR